MYETIFVKGPKFLSTTSNLRAEQNLVHLGRFMHFSQKGVGVTLTLSYRGEQNTPPPVFRPPSRNGVSYQIETFGL